MTATPQLFTPRAGAVFSADIAVPDHARELRFYSRILTTGAEPLWRDDLLNNLGMPIIGLGERTDAHADLPLQWMPHIQVQDVADSAARAVALGGRVLMEGKDVDVTQWAVLEDPNGAAFGSIPVVPAEALAALPSASGPVGRIAWVDATVPNAAPTRDFYRQVVGWTSEDVTMRDGHCEYADFNMLGADGQPSAGICHARGVNVDLPPVWMMYLPVGDLPESLRRVEAEGGRIVRGHTRADGTYVFVVIQDPAGVYLALTPPA